MKNKFFNRNVLLMVVVATAMGTQILAGNSVSQSGGSNVDAATYAPGAEAETSSQPADTVTKVFYEVEQMPQFPDGGEVGLLKWIDAHKIYPDSALKNKIEGKVVVQFFIMEDGSIGEERVARSVDPSLDAEALRIIRLLPDFIPGKFNGKPMGFWYTLPVKFKLPVD